MSLLRKLFIVLALILAAAGGFYYFYWMRTPAYAAGEIQQAVSKRDFQLFQERVDLPKVYGHAIDDLTEEARQSDQRDHRIAAGLMKALKKPLIEEMIRQTQLAFDTNSSRKEDPSPLAAVTRSAEAYVGSAALSLTDIFDVKEENGTATASVRLHDKNLKKDFTWKVLLEKDINGNWTATRILNLKEYLAERKQAILEKR